MSILNDKSGITARMARESRLDVTRCADDFIGGKNWIVVQCGNEFKTRTRGSDGLFSTAGTSFTVANALALAA